MAENIRILLADDHPVLRSGLEALLGLEDGLQVVGQAATGEEAVEKARLLRPDVVVMDLSMPGIGGVEGAEQIGGLGLGGRGVGVAPPAGGGFLLPGLGGGGGGVV